MYHGVESVDHGLVATDIDTLPIINNGPKIFLKID